MEHGHEKTLQIQEKFKKKKKKRVKLSLAAKVERNATGE